MKEREHTDFEAFEDLPGYFDPRDISRFKLGCH